MSRFDFCGGTSQSQSPLADAQLSINWYPEMLENPSSRVRMALYPTPGLSLFVALPTDAHDTGITKAVRGDYTINGRTFAVYGTHLFEITGQGAFTDYGGNNAITGGAANNNISDDGLPVYMVAGGTASGQYPGQLLILSGGALTAFNLATNAFVAITSAPATVSRIEYLDGFFIAMQSGTINDFQVSAALDCTNWPGTSISQVSVYSDRLLSMIVSERLLWVFGATRAVAYYTSGNPIFPFDVVNGGFLEMGIVAQASPIRVNNSIYWLAGDERGEAIIAKTAGFTPQRASDHAFEYWLQQQATISDAVGFSTREQGHHFAHWWFPSANKTWSLDTDLGLWHQRSSLVNGLPSAHLGRCHTYNFGQHLVGDRLSGNIYAMNVNYLNENVGVGVFNPIIRTRRAPHVSIEQEWMIHHKLQIDFETGLGPQPPLTDADGNPRDPVAMLRFSDDGGHTWSNPNTVNCGQAGQFKTRAIWWRLGRSRNRVYEVSVSDPIPWKIVDAYLNATPGYQPQERLAHTYRKSA